MKHYYAWLFSLLLSRPAIAQVQSWQAYPIDTQLTVRFPQPPQEMDIPGTMAANNNSQSDSPQVQASRAFRAEDATALYILVSIPLSESPQWAVPIAEREAYYRNRSIPLLMAQTHGELLEQAVIAKPNLDSFTVKFRALTTDGAPGVKYVRVLTSKQRLYQLYFIPKDKVGTKGTAQRTQFFDAFTFVQGK
jgi:hypothetical protein